MFKEHAKDSQLLFITSILVLLMGIPTFYSLTESDEFRVDKSTIHTSSAGRSPSSVPVVEVAATSHSAHSALTQFAEFDLNCVKRDHSKKHIVAGSYVQLQGKNCIKNFKDGDVEIFNKSNGYTASTLSSGVNKYQTDLIQLQNGENEIVIRYRESSGKIVEDVVRIQSTQI